MTVSTLSSDFQRGFVQVFDVAQIFETGRLQNDVATDGVAVKGSTRLGSVARAGGRRLCHVGGEVTEQ